jgi:hypothetical protein
VSLTIGADGREWLAAFASYAKLTVALVLPGRSEDDIRHILIKHIDGAL